MSFSGLEMAVWLMIISQLYMLFEIYKLRRSRHADRDKLGELNSQLIAIRMDNQQLASMRTEKDQLRVMLDQVKHDLRNQNYELEKCRRENSLMKGVVKEHYPTGPLMDTTS